jgi:hypothetical protein
MISGYSKQKVTVTEQLGLTKHRYLDSRLTESDSNLI